MWMTPKGKFSKIYSDSFEGTWITRRGQIWWKSAVGKLPKMR